MKNLVKKPATIITLWAFALLAATGVKADTITLSVTNSGQIGGNAASFHVPSNVVAQVVYMYVPAANLRLSFGDFPGATTSSFSAADRPIVTGPATLTLSWTNTTTGQSGGISFVTIQTTSSYGFVPSTSVVIPNDGGGAVSIILESSTDLINWVAANPGTYGTTSSNRFFRVRAQR